MWRRLILAAAVLSIGAAHAPAKPPSQWLASESADPLTDSKTPTVALVGDGGLLGLMCLDGKALFITVTTDKFLGDYHGRPRDGAVEYRFDDTPAIRSRWGYDDNQLITARPDSSVAIAHMIMASKRLFVRAHDYRDIPVDVVFDLGDTGPVGTFLEHCG